MEVSITYIYNLQVRIILIYRPPSHLKFSPTAVATWRRRWSKVALAIKSILDVHHLSRSSEILLLAGGGSLPGSGRWSRPAFALCIQDHHKVHLDFSRNATNKTAYFLFKCPPQFFAHKLCSLYQPTYTPSGASVMLLTLANFSLGAIIELIEREVLWKRIDGGEHWTHHEANVPTTQSPTLRHWLVKQQKLGNMAFLDLSMISMGQWWWRKW